MIAIAAFLLFAQATGTVTDSVTHQPIRGAHVKATEHGDSVTGDDGGYTIAHPGAGEVQFRAEARGYRSLETKARITDSGFVKLDVELNPMAKVKGHVVDNDTGEPVAVFLVLQRKGGGFPNAGVANPKDGGFEIGSLEPGDYTLQLSSMNDVRIETGESIPKNPHRIHRLGYPAPIHLEEGQQQVLDIRLPTVTAYRVAGVIEMPAGRDSDALAIGIRRGDSNLSASSTRKHPGPFSIEGLTPDQYTFSARLGTGATALYGELSLSVTDHDIDNVKLNLLPTASLSANIQMAEDGADVPEDVELALFQADGRKAADPVSLHDGRFRVEGLRPGRYWPQLSHLPSGYAQMRSTEGAVSLYGPTELSLVVTSKPGAIVGVVRDENQAPMAGVTAVLATDSPMNKQTRSGRAGEFRFSDVAPGRYTVNGIPIEVGPGQTVNVTVHRVRT